MIDQYLSEFVYGGIDGIITTFSIVAGSTGGDLLKNVIIILGSAFSGIGSWIWMCTC